MEYTITKDFFGEEKVCFLYICFENGDYLSLDGSELVEYSIKVYDKLVRYRKGYCPVVESGYFKLKVGKASKYILNKSFLYNPKEYKKNRKEYIERRCVNESRITEIQLFNELNWHCVLLGNIKAEIDGQYLRLVFLPLPQMGKSSSAEHNIRLGNIKAEEVFGIKLDFENCESFFVYNKEILEIDLVFDKELTWGASELYRKVGGGYIRLKLDKYYNTRNNHLFDNKDLKKRDYERRLCGKKGVGRHDICHLYIDYFYSGFGNSATECVEIEEITSNEKIVYSEEDESEENDYVFESGYSKKLKDGSIIVTFGQTAKQTMKKLSKQFE